MTVIDDVASPSVWGDKQSKGANENRSKHTQRKDQHRINAVQYQNT